MCSYHGVQHMLMTLSYLFSLCSHDCIKKSLTDHECEECPLCKAISHLSMQVGFVVPNFSC